MLPASAETASTSPNSTLPLNLAVPIFRRFHPDHIPRGDTILLTTCADHRVHRLSLFRQCARVPIISRRDGALPCPSRAQPGEINLCLLFSRCGLSPETRRGPRTGPQVQANSISLSCVVEIGQTKRFCACCSPPPFLGIIHHAATALAMPRSAHRNITIR